MSKRNKPRYGELVRQYVDSLSVAEKRQHFTIRKYPSGQGRRGGANRSSTLRREVRLKVTKIEFCPWCGGVSEETAAKTSLYFRCWCPPID